MFFISVHSEQEGERDLQVEKGKLARVVAVLVHEPAGKVAAKDGLEVVLRDLGIVK